MRVCEKVFIDHDRLAAQNRRVQAQKCSTRHEARELTARIWLTTTLRPKDHDASLILYTICLSLSPPFLWGYEWEVYNQVYSVKLTAFLNWEKSQMQSIYDNSEKLETAPDWGLIVLSGAAECNGYWSTVDKRHAKRGWKSGSEHERERNSREGNRAPGYSANTANPVTLLQARTSPFMEWCCKHCVNTASRFSSRSPPFPLPLWPFKI